MKRFMEYIYPGALALLCLILIVSVLTGCTPARDAPGSHLAPPEPIVVTDTYERPAYEEAFVVAIAGGYLVRPDETQENQSIEVGYDLCPLIEHYGPELVVMALTEELADNEAFHARMPYMMVTAARQYLCS